MSFSDFLKTEEIYTWDEFLKTRIAKECCVDADWFEDGGIKQVLVYGNQYFIFDAVFGYGVTLDREIRMFDKLEKAQVALYLSIDDF